MFDKYITHRFPGSVSVNVKEERAPTDDSVRLLSEMEEKARARVVESLSLSENDLHVDFVIFQMNVLTPDYELVGLFRLNGQQHEIRERVRTLDVAHDLNRFRERLWRTLSDAVAAKLLNAVSRQ